MIGDQRMRLMNRSADGKRQTAGESGLLPRLGSDRSLMLAEAVTDLRKLLRVKVEDDQDLVTAQQALSEAGSVRMKLNGKAKVFWYNQELVPELSAAEKAKLAADLAAAKAQVARGADELAQLQKSLKAGRARRSLDELTAEALTLRMEVQNEEAALAKRKGAKGDGGAPALTEAEAKKVKADYSRLLKEYKKRRRQCLEIVDQISEGCGKPPKKLIEEWGLETDEDYGVNQKDFPILDARPAPAAAPSAAGWRR